MSLRLPPVNGTANGTRRHRRSGDVGSRPAPVNRARPRRGAPFPPARGRHPHTSGDQSRVEFGQQHLMQPVEPPSRSASRATAPAGSTALARSAHRFIGDMDRSARRSPKGGTTTPQSHRSVREPQIPIHVVHGPGVTSTNLQVAIDVDPAGSSPPAIHNLAVGNDRDCR